MVENKQVYFVTMNSIYKLTFIAPSHTYAHALAYHCISWIHICVMLVWFKI